jgi:hypothetical protein
MSENIEIISENSNVSKKLKLISDDVKNKDLIKSLIIKIVIELNMELSTLKALGGKNLFKLNWIIKKLSFQSVNTVQQ